MRFIRIPKKCIRQAKHNIILNIIYKTGDLNTLRINSLINVTAELLSMFREDINKQSISIYEEIRADYESYRF